MADRGILSTDKRKAGTGWLSDPNIPRHSKVLASDVPGSSDLLPGDRKIPFF